MQHNKRSQSILLRCCIDSLTWENFQMADRFWNEPLKWTLGHWLCHVCFLQGAFIPDLHTSIWWPDICIWWLLFTIYYYLLAPFLKHWPLKWVFREPLWPSSKIFWLKHCNPKIFVFAPSDKDWDMPRGCEQPGQWSDWFLLKELFCNQ